MKQYTTPEQTAKLIELGFEKPKSISSIKVTGDIITTAEDLIGEPSSVMGGKITANYSIGELIKMLTTIKYIRIAIDSRSDGRTTLIVKRYQKNRWDVLYGNVGPELCDSLFNAVVKLKEEGVI